MEITNELKHCCCFLLLVYVKYQNRFKNYKERRYNTAHYFTVVAEGFSHLTTIGYELISGKAFAICGLVH